MRRTEEGGAWVGTGPLRQRTEGVRGGSEFTRALGHDALRGVRFSRLLDSHACPGGGLAKLDINHTNNLFERHGLGLTVPSSRDRARSLSSTPSQLSRNEIQQDSDHSYSTSLATCAPS